MHKNLSGRRGEGKAACSKSQSPGLCSGLLGNSSCLTAARRIAQAAPHSRELSWRLCTPKADILIPAVGRDPGAFGRPEARSSVEP